ncbi:MAG TPA: hypothetical protein VGY54_22740 [Polyangiaceae bacterium]|nr:hypothetical protein [Polyangiaceae bacterium]
MTAKDQVEIGRLADSMRALLRGVLAIRAATYSFKQDLGNHESAVIRVSLATAAILGSVSLFRDANAVNENQHAATLGSMPMVVRGFFANLPGKAGDLIDD